MPDHINAPLLLDQRYVQNTIAQNRPNDMSTLLFPVIDSAPDRNLIEDSIAVIRVHGAIYSRGWGSYEWITEDFLAALNNPKVDGIIFDIDSPGGVVGGCFDLTDLIFSERGNKPLLAITNERATSAAFAIGSACDRLVLSRTGDVGSVGVLTMHWDISAALEDWGEKVTLIHEGAHKVDGNPFQPLPDDVKHRIQAELKTIYDMFVATIARNRAMEAADVAATEALVYMGQGAVDIGFADEVIAPKEAIEEFIEFTNLRSRNMPIQIKDETVRKELALCSVTEGTSLAACLNSLIDALVSDDKDRDAIVKDVAAAAKLQVATVELILDASVNGPPLENLKGFASALDTTVESLVEKAKEDGCEYELEDPGEEDLGDQDPAARIKSIIESPHAEDREDLAKKLAFDTKISAAEAESILEATPKATKDPLSEFMNNQRQPGVGPDDPAPSDDAAVDKSWDAALSRVGAKLKSA